MAEIYTSDGKVVPVDPDPNVGYFTMKTIYSFLQDIVEPIFIGTQWLFHCKRGKDIGLELNKNASDMTGLQIYGDVLLAEDFELSTTFFIPDDLKYEILKTTIDLQRKYENEFKKLSKGSTQKKSKKIKSDDLINTEFPEDNNKADTEYVINSTYQSLFENKKTFNQIMKEFLIYFDDVGELYEVANNYNDRIKILDKLLEFYTESEDYEKCINIREFINKMKKHYKIEV